MQHLGIGSCLFGEEANKIAKMCIGDVLNKAASTIIGAMLKSGLSYLIIYMNLFNYNQQNEWSSEQIGLQRNILQGTGRKIIQCLNLFVGLPF